MAKMTGFKVYRGTKETFISSGKATTYAEAIVFITGGTGNEKNSCIFAQGTYFASITQMMEAINYVKGISVGGQSYNAAANGGYVAFGAADPTTVAVNAGQNGVQIGLTDTFVSKVNGTATALGTANDAANSTGTAFARIANLAALVSDLTGGSTESIAGQINAAVDALRTEITGTLDTDDSKTLAAINDELDGLDAKVKALEEAGFIKIGDVQSEIAKLSGTEDDGDKVKVTVSTSGGEVNGVSVDETGLNTALDGKADLDEAGKILATQLPDYILGQVMFGGMLATYDASTGAGVVPTENFKEKYGITTTSATFTVTNADASKYEGVYFIVGGPVGPIFDLETATGDWIISTGSSWSKVDNTDAVSAVAGLTGNITATALAKKLAEIDDANELALKSEVDAVEVTASGDGTLITASASNKRTISVAPTTKLSNAVAKAETAYQKPSTGIPSSDLAQAVRTSLGKADSAYQLNLRGIPKSDLESSVQTSLGKADAAAPQETTYTKDEVDAMWEWEVIS